MWDQSRIPNLHHVPLASKCDISNHPAEVFDHTSLLTPSELSNKISLSFQISSLRHVTRCSVKPIIDHNTHWFEYTLAKPVSFPFHRMTRHAIKSGEAFKTLREVLSGACRNCVRHVQGSSCVSLTNSKVWWKYSVWASTQTNWCNGRADHTGVTITPIWWALLNAWDSLCPFACFWCSSKHERLSAVSQ